MKILERYAQAMSAGDLCSDDRSTYAGADVFGAIGFAGKVTRAALTEKQRPGRPLGMALLRFYSGGTESAREIVETLAAMACDRAETLNLRPRLRHVQAKEIAIGVLSWHRNSVCRPCGGHGFMPVGAAIGDGRAVIGDVPCHLCRGAGKRDFDGLFALERLWLAQWLRATVEREHAAAGAEASRALVDRMAT